MTPKKGREDEFAEVRQLKASGMSNAEISRRTGVPPNTVTRWCPEYVRHREHPYRKDEIIVDNPGDSLPEIQVSEEMLAKLIDEKTPAPVIIQMAVHVAKLRKEWEASRIRAGELLSKEAIQRFGIDLVAIVTKEFQDVPDWEERAGRIVAWIQSYQYGNTQREINRFK
ncbi:hypothetical protein [Lacipirellula parvula]|uniref:Uncharacterized protein n=1 Tax=Lacipirellula parvula TaxID=2650471 RepID=A0A5K7X9Y3_9BACT|nr:hypothetical protein [Lacipirellula parvula]BBO31561.1 hypothetical protein PLANPX_1173 [Lacipirellula parvula]